MEFNQEVTTQAPKSTSKPPGRLAASLTELNPVERPPYAVGWMVVRVVAIYVITGALWILLSDRLLNALVQDHELVMKLSMVKGWTYVVVTAALLFVLLRRETRHWIAERTAREAAEATTRESEARFRQLFELAPVPIVFYRYNGEAISHNRQFKEALGYTSADAATVAQWRLLAHPDEAERREAAARWDAATKRAIQANTTIEPEEYKITCKDGQVRTFLISGSLLGDGALVALVDLTAQKMMEAALKEKTELFRQMAENIDEVFWVASVRLDKILFISLAYEKIWERTCESLYANPGSWAAAIHPDDRERVLAAAKKRQVGEGYTESYRIVRPDEQVRWIHVRTFPVRDSGGRVFRMVGVATDITERRKLEEQFRHAQKMEALGTLAGGIAHDFNNIIGAITGYAELAKMDSTLPAVQSCHDEILSACGRAGDLVRQILAFSRQREQKRTPLKLWQTVTEATRLLRAVLPATVEFHIELDRDAPVVLADPTQIHQVVMNLCTNALHAMAGKVGRLGVGITTFHADEQFARAHAGGRVGRYACLAVSDTGHGMEQLVLDRIFEPFFTTKAPGEGTGLGLSVVHGIVQAHDGIITVVSTLDAGTTFNLYFPAYEGGLVETSSKDESPAVGRGQRIMVVDDEASLTRMIGKSLVKLGYATETMSDPLEALAAFRMKPENYELIITDLTMPHMTGLELGAFVHNEKPQMPIALMTGFSESLTNEQLKLAGIKEVLLKPMTLQGLGRAVERLLKQ